MTNKFHVFEEASLGKAPFRCVGHEDTSIGANSDGMVRKACKDGLDCYTKPGGSCDFCGTYIVQFFWIESVDGKRFKVGSECALKTGDKGIKKVINKIKSDRARQQRNKRDIKKITYIKEQLLNDDSRKKLNALEHPLKWRQEEGETLLDWVEWMLENSGAYGRAKVYKIIKDILDK